LEHGIYGRPVSDTVALFVCNVNCYASVFRFTHCGVIVTQTTNINIFTQTQLLNSSVLCHKTRKAQLMQREMRDSDTCVKARCERNL